MKAHTKFLAQALALLLLPVGANAQTPAQPAPAANAVTAAPPPEMVELRRAGYAASYSLDYATARAKFEEIRRRWPQHPAGDLYLANVVWLEHLFKLRRLQTGLYQNESFYAGVENSNEENEQGDTVDPQVDRTFRGLMAAAKGKAQAFVTANRKDAHARYYLGAVYGVLAGYEASTARKFFSAMRNGSRSVEQHQQTVKLDPNYIDAYLTIGLYDYVIGSLPFPLRALTTLGGMRGSKERGIRQLRQLIEQKAENADDARVMLLAIHQNEKRPDLALTLLEDLGARFPANFLFKLERAAVLSQLDRTAEAQALFEELLKDAPRHAPLARLLDLIHFQYAESLAAQNAHERAAAEFVAAARSPQAEAGLATFALLRAAQSYDLASKRDEAVAQYKAVLARPNVYDSRERAEKGIKQPFRESDRMKRSD
jgi:hypothetical protein